MKKTPFTILYLLLAALFTANFCGCQKADKEGGSSLQNGVVISQEAPYSAETQGYAKRVLFSLLQHYAQKNAIGNLPEATVKELETVSTEIGDLLSQKPVSEGIYVALIETLEKKGKSVVDEVVSYRKGESSALTETKVLYLSLSALLGSDYVGGVLYDLYGYQYDRDYKKTMANYEKYGYSFLLEDAKVLDTERQILRKEIGERNFSSVLKMSFAFVELFFGEGFTSAQFASFTDTEIVTFLQKLGLSSLSLTKEGWGLILSKALPEENITAEDSYGVKLIKTAKKAGDIPSIAAVMGDFVKLTATAVDKLEEKDVDSLRKGEYNNILHSVFSKFDETDWMCFSNVTACNLSVESYEEVAFNEYGKKYETYRAGMRSLTLEQLKAAVGQDAFYDSLKGYIAGISPAFSYGMEL